MPRLAALKTAVMADLAEQVRFASRAALMKQIEHAEALASEIDLGLDYPEGWLIFRVTGFVPEHDAGRLIAGRDVLADLSALVEQLCVGAGLHEHDPDAAGEAWFDTDALRARWGVTRRTIERYRREGLIARRVISQQARGRARLIFRRSTVETFERRRAITGRPPASGGQAPRRAVPRRTRPEDHSAWACWARRFIERTGCPWPEAIRRLARRTGRSESTIRRALKKPAPCDPSPAFRRAPRIGAEQRRVIVRAFRLGVRLSAIGEHYQRRPPAIARALALGRLEQLRGWSLPVVVEPATALDDPRLAAEALRSDDAPWPETPEAFQSLVASESRTQPMRADMESALAAAHTLLLRVAGGVAASLPPGALNADRIDEAETALRWASRLRRRLLRAALPLVARTLRERDLLHGPPHAAVRALNAAASAVHSWSPDRGGRLAAPISLALAKELAAVRPASQRPSGHAARPAPRLTICAWDTALSMSPRLARALPHLDEADRAVIESRFGTADTPPMTMHQIELHYGVTSARWWAMYRLAVKTGPKA